MRGASRRMWSSAHLPLPQRKLGDLEVSCIGLGAMPLSISGRPDRSQALQVLHAALDAGVTLIDTADAYCIDQNDMGHNESLITEALETYKGQADLSRVVIATKGGCTRLQGDWGADGRPEHLEQACARSKALLKVVQSTRKNRSQLEAAPKS